MASRERTWPATHTDGKRATIRRAHVTPTSAGLVVATGRRRSVWRWEEVRQSAGRWRGQAVALDRGEEEGESVVIRDPGILAAVGKVARPLPRGFGRPGTTREVLLKALGVALATAALGALLYFHGVPLFATVVLPFVPESWDKRMGEMTLRQLAPEKERYDGGEWGKKAAEMAGRLMPGGGASRFRIIFVHNKMVNAFALPGNTVVVCEGLLKTIKKPGELAGILAHEFQHGLARHPTRFLIEQATLGTLSTILVGDVSGLAAYGAEAARVLGTLRYSRSLEESADRGAVAMMKAAGYDPADMAGWLGREAKGGKAWKYLKYLSTHPDPEARARKMK